MRPGPDQTAAPLITVEDLRKSYGETDAVAGVINFITRSNYDGLLLSGEAGYAENYNKLNASMLWGTNWQNGGAMFAFQHSYLSDLALNTRVSDYNFIPLGGTNQNTFNCSPATIQIAGVTDFYRSATATTTTTCRSCCSARATARSRAVGT